MKKSTIDLFNDSYFDDFVQIVYEKDDNLVLKKIADKLADKEVVLDDIEEKKLNPEELSLLGNLYYMLDNKEKAKDLILKAVEITPTSEYTYLRAGNLMAMLGDGNKAYEFLSKGKEKFPNNPYYEKSLFYLLKNQYVEIALENLKGAMEKKLFTIDFLEDAYKYLLENDNFEVVKRRILLRSISINDKKLKSIHLAQLAYFAYKNSEFSVSKDYIINAVNIDDSDINVRKLFLFLMDKYEETSLGATFLKQWQEKYDFITDYLGYVEVLLNSYITGVKNLKDILDEIKDRLYTPAMQIKWNILYAEYYEREDKFEKAKEIYEELFKKYPNHTEVVNKLSAVCVTLGDKERAKKLVKDFIERTGNLMIPYEFDKEDENLVKIVEDSLDQITDPLQKSAVLFKLAEYYQKLKDYKKAAHIVNNANAIVWQKVKDLPIIRNYDKLIERIIKVFSDKEFMDNLRNKEAFDKRPIFIVGMPRSGTTLVEQILKAGGVYDCGELTIIDPKMLNLIEENKLSEYPEAIHQLKKEEFKALGEIYINSVKEIFEIDSDIFSDKQTHNFLHIGLIYMMFPNAKVINMRRDYRSIALSNYFIDFLSKKSFMAFSFNLEAFAKELKGYFKLSKHWSNIMPNNFYKEVWYEDVVLNQEKMTKEIVEFCELEYTPELLKFYEKTKAIKTASVMQARKPIYKDSLNKWKNYEDLLQPIIDILGDEGTYKGEI